MERQEEGNRVLDVKVVKWKRDYTPTAIEWMGRRYIADTTACKKGTTIVNFPVKKLTEGATLPKRAAQGDAGLDLYASESVVIPAFGSTSVPTGIAIELPEGYFGKVEPRSGMSFRHDIETGAGVIDAGYRGEIRIKMYNYSDKPFTIFYGDRAAQLLILPVMTWTPKEVKNLNESSRGIGGFGHTGR